MVLGLNMRTVKAGGNKLSKQEIQEKKAKIRVKKSKRNFLIRLSLWLNLLNLVGLGLLVAIFWERIVKWVQTIL